jgi:myosin-crossreactive antigen
MFLVQDNSKNNYLTENHIESITEACFDWLIEEYRVAVKHHAVYTLIETGKHINWVYPELRTILEKEIEFPSPGYRSIVKKFLRLI